MQEERRKGLTEKQRYECYEVNYCGKWQQEGKEDGKMKVQEGNETSAERRAGYIYFKNPLLFLFLKIIWDRNCILHPWGVKSLNIRIKIQ